MNSKLCFGLLLSVLVGCGGSPQGGQPPPPPGGTTPKRDCVSPSGQVVTCPIPVNGSVCMYGSANSCAMLTLEELTTSTPPCLHLVISNQCGQEIYSDTCIEYTNQFGTYWQCWRSSTDVSGVIDVAQCGATGRYFRYSDRDSGQIDVVQSECPKPK
jgi:hypothetical protein